ncbi:MAG: hypothetical protein K6E95_00650 [Lachnospiraceae bacterium]|nr:hypothetical protein [Lachnospiraceae bacterium]
MIARPHINPSVIRYTKRLILVGIVMVLGVKMCLVSSTVIMSANNVVSNSREEVVRAVRAKIQTELFIETAVVLISVRQAVVR